MQSPMYAPTAPPYHPHLHHPQHHITDGVKQGVLPSVHYQHHSNFESVDLESGPASPQPHANRPMMPVHHVGGTSSHNQNSDQEDGNSQPTKKRRRYRQCLLVASVVLILVLTSVVTGVLVLHFGAGRREPIPASNLHTNCVSCVFLQKAMSEATRSSNHGVSVNIKDLDIKSTEDGTLLCCLKATEKTDNLLQKLLEHARQSVPPMSPEQRVGANMTGSDTTSSTTARATHSAVMHRNQAAAFVGLERPIPSTVSDDDIYTLKEWGTESSSFMYIRPEIKYTVSNGHFTVPHDGLYTINIHLSLSNRHTDKMVNFRQRLMRFNRHYPQAKNEALAYDDENVPPAELRTSSLALTVHLRKDDELFAEVSPASVIVETSSRSFFCVVFQSA